MLRVGADGVALRGICPALEPRVDRTFWQPPGCRHGLPCPMGWIAVGALSCAFSSTSGGRRRGLALPALLVADARRPPGVPNPARTAVQIAWPPERPWSLGHCGRRLRQDYTSFSTSIRTADAHGLAPRGHLLRTRAPNVETGLGIPRRLDVRWKGCRTQPIPLLVHQAPRILARFGRVVKRLWAECFAKTRVIEGQDAGRGAIDRQERLLNSVKCTACRYPRRDLPLEPGGVSGTRSAGSSRLVSRSSAGTPASAHQVRTSSGNQGDSARRASLTALWVWTYWGGRTPGGAVGLGAIISPCTPRRSCRRAGCTH